MSDVCTPRTKPAVRRRDVLGLLTATVLAPLAARGRAQALSRVGLHLGGLREAVRANPLAALRMVAAIGYKEIELWTLAEAGLDLVDLRRTLDRLSLTSPSRHVAMPAVFSNWRRLLTEGRVLGARYLVCDEVPTPQRAALDGYARVADLLNGAGRITQSLGIQLALHPHADDFRPRNGIVPYELLLRNTDPALVKIQMDLALMAQANRDPLDDFARYPGRFVSVHVNDISAAPATAPVDLGAGRIDLPRVLGGAVRAGITHYFIDDARADSPWEHAKANFMYLSTLTL